MPIIAHVGIDGSGKSYGMAADCERLVLKNRKQRSGREVWSLRPMEGARRLKHPHQIIYLENSDIFLDELQRYYPATNGEIDEITHHIISTHRHQKNTIHWASQDWRYVHFFWRYETSHAWVYRAIMRDPETGESKIHRHRRILIPGVDLELKRRKFRIEKKQNFWITKKGISRFNSYEKIEVAMREVTPEYIATIEDPRSDFVLPDDVEKSKHHEGETDPQQDGLNIEHHRQNSDAESDRQDDSKELEGRIDEGDPPRRPFWQRLGGWPPRKYDAE